MKEENMMFLSADGLAERCTASTTKPNAVMTSMIRCWGREQGLLLLRTSEARMHK